MWESLFGSAVTPAVASGIGETAVNSALPALTDTALTGGIDQALAGTLPNQLGNATAGLGANGTFQALGQAPMYSADGMLIPESTGGMMNIAGLPMADTASALSPTTNGMFGQWGDKAMGVLGSDQFKNATALGVGGFNAINQGKAISNANKIQQEQLKMSKDAYNRDKTAEQNRQKLVF